MVCLLQIGVHVALMRRSPLPLGIRYFSVLLTYIYFRNIFNFFLCNSINNETQATLADNTKVITFDIKVVADIALVIGKSTPQVAYTGKIKGEKAMIDMDDIGTEVEYRFAVSVSFSRKSVENVFWLFFFCFYIIFKTY